MENEISEYPLKRRIFNRVSRVIDFNRTVIKILDLPAEMEEEKISGYLRNNSDSLIFSNAGSQDYYIAFSIVSKSSCVKKVVAAFTEKKYIDKIISDAADKNIFFDEITSAEIHVINFIFSNFKFNDFILVLKKDDSAFTALILDKKLVYIRTIDTLKTNQETELQKTLSHIIKKFNVNSFVLFSNIELKIYETVENINIMEKINFQLEKIYISNLNGLNTINLNLMPQENKYNYSNIKRNSISNFACVAIIIFLSIVFIIFNSIANKNIYGIKVKHEKLLRFISKNNSEYIALFQKEKIIKAETENPNNLSGLFQPVNYLYLNIISNSIPVNMSIISIEREKTGSAGLTKYQGYGNKSSSQNIGIIRIKGISFSENTLLKYTEQLNKSDVFSSVQIEYAAKNSEGLFDFVLNISGRIE